MTDKEQIAYLREALTRIAAHHADERGDGTITRYVMGDIANRALAGRILSSYDELCERVRASGAKL